MKKKRECYLLRFMVIIYVAIVFTMTLGTGIVCAASDPLAVIGNLSTFFFFDPSNRVDFARLWYRADWFVVKIS